jgi:hypothetical protein
MTATLNNVVGRISALGYAMVMGEAYRLAAMV